MAPTQEEILKKQQNENAMLTEYLKVPLQKQMELSQILEIVNTK